MKSKETRHATVRHFVKETKFKMKGKSLGAISQMTPSSCYQFGLGDGLPVPCLDKKTLCE